MCTLQTRGVIATPNCYQYPNYTVPVYWLSHTTGGTQFLYLPGFFDIFKTLSTQDEVAELFIRRHF